MQDSGYCKDDFPSVAQVDYYTNYIRSRADWQLVKVYTDEGISATNTKKRDGFNRMVQDALDGKIDLIVTKSVSRFARNTADSLTTVRKMKEVGVEIYFEKENIWTLDSKGEPAQYCHLPEIVILVGNSLTNILKEKI